MNTIAAVAIVFMHAYRYPEHERQVAALAREMGFAQVSVSHEVSPLIKLVGRGDTTVVDAYLSPILRRYVAQVAGEMTAGALSLPLPLAGEVGARSAQGGGAVERVAQASAPSLTLPRKRGREKKEQADREEKIRLMFMMSSGGLTAAELFQG